MSLVVRNKHCAALNTWKISGKIALARFVFSIVVNSHCLEDIVKNIILLRSQAVIRNNVERKIF